jgi:hypothetical protein
LTTQLATRVTRLDEFSPDGRLLTFGKSFLLQKKSKILGYLIRKNILHMKQSLTNTWLGCIWAIFSQTHLVTLLATATSDHDPEGHYFLPLRYFYTDNSC